MYTEEDTCIHLGEHVHPGEEVSGVPVRSDKLRLHLDICSIEDNRIHPGEHVHPGEEVACIHPGEHVHPGEEVSGFPVRSGEG